MNILQQVARRLERLEALDKGPSRWPGRSAARCGRAWCATCSAAPTWAPPAPDADRPADRSVGDVGPAGRRRRPGRRGAVDVNRTAWEQRPSQWTPVLADTELADGELCRADAGGVPVLCTGQTKRCMPRPAPALTWAAHCRRTQSAMAASPAHGPAAPSGSPMAASCAARPARQSPATGCASRTGASRSAPSHRRCGPQPSARVVTEDTVLRASNGPDRRGCSITQRRIFRAGSRPALVTESDQPIGPVWR